MTPIIEKLLKVLMKNFVKAMDRDGDGFKFLKDFFGAEKTDAKLKAGVFVRP